MFVIFSDLTVLLVPCQLDIAVDFTDAVISGPLSGYADSQS